MFQFAKPRRPVSRVFLHCSASDGAGDAFTGAGLVATIEAWHRARGFREIGYHFVIDKAGAVMPTARGLEETPAAQQGHNAGTIAICCHGLVEKLFTAAQLLACLELCRSIDAAYGGGITFHGHREVSIKTCPVFDYRRLLDLDAFGRMTKNPARPARVLATERRPSP